MAKILLADDNEELLDLQSIFLKRAGHEVFPVANGVQALKLLATQPIDLVITDIVMPDMEGLELIMNLRKRMPDVKIIAMSGGGYSKPNDYLAIAKSLGARETLRKPFTRPEMVELVNRVLGSEA